MISAWVTPMMIRVVPSEGVLLGPDSMISAEAGGRVAQLTRSADVCFGHAEDTGLREEEKPR